MGVVARGPLACNSSLCTFLCLATISLVISLVLYVSFVTDFCGGVGEAGLRPLSPTFEAGRQTGSGLVCHHSLDRLNASMIKQKKKKKKRLFCFPLSYVDLLVDSHASGCNGFLCTGLIVATDG